METAREVLKRLDNVHVKKILNSEEKLSALYRLEAGMQKVKIQCCFLRESLKKRLATH